MQFDLQALTNYKRVCRHPIAWYRSRAADSLNRRFALAAGWSIVGTVLSQGVVLFASFVNARYLGKVAFGELGAILSTVITFGVLAGMGLGLTATKYIAELRNIDVRRTGTIIGLAYTVAICSGVACTGGFFAMAPWLASKALNAANLEYQLKIASALILLNTISGVQTGALSGFEAFREIARANAYRGILSIPFLVGGVVYAGLNGAVWGFIGAAVVGVIVNYIFLKRCCDENRITVRFGGLRTERGILWRFSLPAVLTGSLVTPVTWIANAILVQQPNGYAEMGLFSAANQWRSLIQLLPYLLSQPLIPILASLYGKRDFHQSRAFLWRSLRIVVATVAAIAFPIACASPWIMKWYGPAFSGHGLILILLALTTLLSTPCAVIGNAIISSDRMWAGFGLNFVWACAFLLFSYNAIPRWGALGMALAYLLSYGIHTMLTIVYALRPQSFAGDRSGSASAPVLEATRP